MKQWRFYVQGWLLELINQREAALAAYRAAVRVKPDFLRATNRLAYMYASLERYADAEPIFREVLKHDPGNAVAHFNLGYTLDKRGDPEAAIVEFREATRLNPKIDRAWYGMGLAYATLGQHSDAANALHEAATLQPMNPHAWYHLGMAYHSSHQPDKVHEVVKHLLRFDPRMTRRLIVDAERTDLAHLVKDLRV